MERTIRNIRDNENSKKQLNKIVKKVEKLARELDVQLSVEKSEVEERKLSIFSHFVGDIGDQYPIYKNIFLNVFDVTLTMDTEFKFGGGWSLVALVGHFEGFLIPLSGEKVPSKFDPNNTHCDHCNTKRYRRKSFIIKNEDGEFKQIGSTCLKKFLGINPKKYFKILNEYLNVPKSFDEFNGEEFGGGFKVWNSNLRAVDLDLIINMVDYQINLDDKFIKNEWEPYTYTDYMGNELESMRRNNEGESTPDKVSISFEDIEKYELTNEKVNIKINTEIVEEFKNFLNSLEVNPKTREVEEFNYESQKNELKTIKDYTNFQRWILSIKEFSNIDSIKFMDISKVSSAYNYFLKEKNKEEKPESEHMGVVGEKFPIIATVVSISSFTTQYGMSNVYRMEDDNGNVYVKFGKINQRYLAEGDNIEKGSTLKFKGTVKKHDSFNDVKQTIIGRCSKY